MLNGEPRLTVKHKDRHDLHCFKNRPRRLVLDLLGSVFNNFCETSRMVGCLAY